MKITLSGATGFAGGEVLRQALNDAAIERVTVLTRRPIGITHAKLRELVLGDFLDYRGVDLSDCDACIWCLGVSQTRVSEEAYIRITFDYAMAAAKAMFAANPRLRFCFVSGRSADPTETKAALFARIKGRTERALSALGADVVNFRPGYIRASAQSGPRKDLARLAAPLGALITLFNADFSVDCDQLARCLLDVAKDGSDQKLLLNASIRGWYPHKTPDAAPRLAD